MQNVSTAVPFVWTNMPLLPKSFSDLMSEDLAVKLQEQEKKQQKKVQQEEVNVLSLLSDEDLAIALGQMSDAELEAYFLSKEQKDSATAAAAATPTAIPTVTPTVTPTATATQAETKQETTATTETDADYLLALKLQQEEEESARPYERPNTNFNKISVVQSRSVLLESFGEQDPEDDEDEEEEVVLEKVIPRSFGKSVKKTSTGEYITKHNPAQNAKRNAQQIEKFTSTANILGNLQGSGKKAANGSEFGDQIVINQTIYNTLRNFARKQDSQSSRYKPQDELFSTQEKVLDNRTRVALLKMLNNGVFGEVNGVISTGKESSVYHAWGLEEEAEEVEDEEDDDDEWEDVPEDSANNKPSESLTSSVVIENVQEKEENKKVSNSQEKESQETPVSVPGEQTTEEAKAPKPKKHKQVPEKPVFDEYAIKIFKTTLNEFKNRSSYMETDLSKQNPRKIIKLWVEKEMKNLKKLQEFNIPTPTPVHYKDHILVMSFLGEGGVPAPKLKEAQLKPKQVQKIYSQIVECMRTMYQKCSLVHADLSEYNILVHNNLAYFIDVSQSVDITHPNAMEFLQRDCQSITSFFQRKDCSDVMSQKELLEFITSPEPAEPSQDDDE